MRPNIIFFGLCLVVSIKFITFVVQIRTFTCDDANSPTPKSLEKECRLVEGKHKKSVIGAWFSDILKLRTLHGQLRNLATVMPMGM